MAVIDSYMESLSNCSGRFRTLAGAWPLTDSEGRPLFVAGSRSVLFRIIHGGRRYLLRCPISMSVAERATTGKLVLEVRHLDNPFIARCDYLPAELLIYDDHGRLSRADVVLEEEPDGEPFDAFLRGRRMLSDKRPLRELLKGLAAMAEELSRVGLVHGNLTPRNVIVSGSGVPVAVDYAMSHDKRADNDTRALALLVLNTYIAGCGAQFTADMPGNGSGATEIRMRNLKHIRTQAEFLRLKPLAAIAAILSKKGTGTLSGANAPIADRMEFNAAAADLAGRPFVPLPLLDSLTEMGTDGEENNVAGHAESASPAPAGHTAARTHNEDTTLRIDFGKCDFAAPVADTLIRFRIGERWDFADRYGNSVTVAGFLDAGDFYEGLAVVATEQGRGVIDRSGGFIMEPVFEMIEWYGRDNVIAACADGKWDLYDRRGRRLTAGAYDWLGDCSEGRFLARRGSRFGFLLADGSSLTEMRFDDAYSFRNGTATVKSGTEIYTIDMDGRKLT